MVILAMPVAVFGQGLLGEVAAVYVGRGVVAVVFLVEEGVHRQALALRGLLVGVAHAERGQREYEARQAQLLDNLPGGVERRAQIADAQPLGLGGGGEALGEDHRVDGRVEEGEQVVVARRGAALLTPEREAAVVDAEGEQQRGALHHGLPHVERREGALAFGRSGLHHAVELHVAARGAAGRRLQEAGQLPVGHGLRRIAPYAPARIHGIDECHSRIGCFKKFLCKDSANERNGSLIPVPECSLTYEKIRKMQDFSRKAAVLFPESAASFSAKCLYFLRNPAVLPTGKASTKQERQKQKFHKTENFPIFPKT